MVLGVSAASDPNHLIAMTSSLTISIVSHGHCKLVGALLNQLITVCCLPNFSRIVVTLNIPELEEINDSWFTLPAGIQVLPLKNAKPKGFGANHNEAFKYCDTDYFCVLNPDIAFQVDPFPSLLAVLAGHQVGCAYPVQINVAGAALDSERELTGPWSVISRHLPFVGERFRSQSLKVQKFGSVPVCWVNGAFMMFKSDVFRRLGGFDERYFMYCEDVDICLRLQLAGHTLARADATVIHDTQRRTLRDFHHFAWHVRSLFRLWNSRAYRDFKQRFVV